MLMIARNGNEYALSSYKRNEKLTEKNRWYVERYLGMSEELMKTYELKEVFCEWFDWAKSTSDIVAVKAD